MYLLRVFFPLVCLLYMWQHLSLASYVLDMYSMSINGYFRQIYIFPHLSVVSVAASVSCFIYCARLVLNVCWWLLRSERVFEAELLRMLTSSPRMVSMLGSLAYFTMPSFDRSWSSTNPAAMTE